MTLKELRMRNAAILKKRERMRAERLAALCADKVDVDQVEKQEVKKSQADAVTVANKKSAAASVPRKRGRKPANRAYLVAEDIVEQNDKDVEGTVDDDPIERDEQGEE